MGFECPQCFDDDARTAWRDVVAELKRRGTKLIPTDSSRAALVFYCREHANWSFLTRLLAECASDKAGDDIPSLNLPVLSESILVDIQKDALESWNRANEWGAVFSLSPPDRIRIHNIPRASIPRRRRPGRSSGRSGSRA